MPAGGASSAPNDLSSRLPLRTGAALDADIFQKVRRRALLEGCKWDPQVRDTPTLAPFPLLLRRSEWDLVAKWAENLSAEAFAAEREIVTDWTVEKEVQPVACALQDFDFKKPKTSLLAVSTNETRKYGKAQE